MQFGGHLDGTSPGSARAKPGADKRPTHKTSADKRSAGSSDAGITTDSLSPGASLADLHDSQFVELVKEMLDGPGRVDLVMEFFGLTRCKSTVVGNQMLRGVSGGERKRLSTVEMLMGGQQVLLLDEISTGLVRPRSTCLRGLETPNVIAVI